MNILIKYATRNRPQWFRRAILNIHQTIQSTDFQILVSADRDDISMTNPNMVDFINHHERVKIVYGDSTNKIEAINRDMDKADPWDLLINMSDDMVFCTPGWDNVIKQRMLDRFPEGDCFLHFNDGYAGDALPTMSIMDRIYYKRDHYIYHPTYKSFSCDAEAMYVAMMRGMHAYFPDLLFKHQHPGNTPMANDETYRVNSLHTPHDTQNYFERLRRYFDEPSGHDILKARPELKQYL